MEYRKEQIQKVIDKSAISDFRPSIQITCEDIHTNYLDITHEELFRIQQLLKKDII